MSKKVIIDIGHYKCDSGAVATHDGKQYTEVEFNLSISEKIKSELSYRGVTVVFTSGTLQDRSKYENKNKCDLFVSIHCNSYNGSASGTETLIHAKGGNAEKLAKKIQSNLGSNLSIPNRGVRVAKEYLGYDLHVLKYTNAPAVLVECAFIDNKTDIEILKNKQNVIASSIADAIIEQLGIKENNESVCNCCYCKTLRK